MRSNIKLQLNGLTPVKLLALSRNVVSKMTDNPHFPTPAVDLKTITDLGTELEVAIEDSTNGSRQSRLHRNDLVLDLQNLMRSEADYVRGVCNGDRTMLESSGYELSKIREKQPIPGSPIIKAAIMTGVQGQVELKWSSEKTAKVYQVWMTDSDPADAVSWAPVAITSKVSTLVDNLESYKAYWFCVSAIGAAGEGVKSDPSIARAA